MGAVVFKGTTVTGSSEENLKHPKQQQTEPEAEEGCLLGVGRHACCRHTEKKNGHSGNRKIQVGEPMLRKKR